MKMVPMPDAPAPGSARALVEDPYRPREQTLSENYLLQKTL
uniref:Alternative protein YTHDF1 n=1 Tax=Homo sapiens TaxID=9606 RepID=L8EA03_HUMAN|nr:alternative protein YTHDF1 [Homo sapiens]